MGFTDALAVADRAVRQQLGETVTYTPGVGEAVEVEGVFDAVAQVVDPENPGVVTPSPAVFLTLDDLPSNPETDTSSRVTIRGTTYRAHTVRADGQGGVLLQLHEV